VSYVATWKLFPDDGGYLGQVHGAASFVVLTYEIGRLGLPRELELEVLAFHEYATGERVNDLPAAYEVAVQMVDAVSEAEIGSWAIGLAARLESALVERGWKVRVDEQWLADDAVELTETANGTEVVIGRKRFLVRRDGRTQRLRRWWPSRRSRT